MPKRKRHGLPPRKLIRYLIAKPRQGGACSLYWQPPTKLRKLAGRPDWLRATPLKDRDGRWLPLDHAMQRAEQLNARLDQWRQGKARHAGEMAALLARWKESPDWAEMAPRTRADYEKHVTVLTKDIGDVAAEQVTKPAVMAYVDHLAAKTSLGKVQIGHRVAVLRQFWNWASKRGYVATENPAAKLGLAKSEPRQELWPVEKLRALRRLPYPVGLATLLALYTVQREGDILRLRWSDYDGMSLRLKQGKTGKLMLLPLCRRLRAALRCAPRRGETILANRQGEPYTENGFRASLRRHQAKLRPCPPFHAIRRTASTWLRRDGLGDDDVILWTGHKQQGERAMLDVYVVRGEEMARKAHPVMQRWRV